MIEILAVTVLIEAGVIFALLRKKVRVIKLFIDETSELEEGLQGDKTYEFYARPYGRMGTSLPQLGFVLNGYELSNVIRYCKNLESKE